MCDFFVLLLFDRRMFFEDFAYAFFAGIGHSQGLSSAVYAAAFRFQTHSFVSSWVKMFQVNTDFQYSDNFVNAKFEHECIDPCIICAYEGLN